MDVSALQVLLGMEHFALQRALLHLFLLMGSAYAHQG